VGDGAVYVTGMQLRVNAGGYLKWYDYQNRTTTISRRHR
jgi:hypothetical protein